MNRLHIACAAGAAVCAMGVGSAAAQTNLVSGMGSITEDGQSFEYSFFMQPGSVGEGTLRVFGLGDYSVVPPSSETMTWDVDGIASDVGFGPDAFEGPVDLFQNAVDQSWTISASDMAAITADGMFTVTLTNGTSVGFFPDQPDDFLAFELTYEIIPAPTSAAVLGLGALAATRRRR
ncbi:MAG: hypothetical protein AAFN41_04575 [Planctomycetota bacterium]